MIWNADHKIMCVECGKKPAILKHLKLCRICYHKNSYLKKHSDSFKEDAELHPRVREKYEHKAEVFFAQNHPGFIYEPAIFHLHDTRYEPDFYDPRSNTFYEVIGSRQRYHQLKSKIALFRVLYPEIKLEICHPDGKLYESGITEQV